MSSTHGLTLGKYAPFHKGHQYVIETALAEMDEVTVIIYDAPETTFVPLSVRSRWIKHWAQLHVTFTCHYVFIRKPPCSKLRL